MMSFQYPYWPKNNPFHHGEVKIQEIMGTAESVAEFAPKFIRPFLPDQHREFYTAQPFLVVAARDSQGDIWSTLITDIDSGRNDFVTSPSPTLLSIRGGPVAGDALEGCFQLGDDVGILGIEFAAKRRNRVNGRIVSANPKEPMEFKVDQSFGNCPQYIRPRQWWQPIQKDTNECEAQSNSSRVTSILNLDQVAQIQGADTVFVASGYRGEGEDARFGNDASHRGGAPGWVHVEDFSTLLLPDYSGNDMYNTLGNLYLDPRMGITIPNFEKGGLLQLTGTVKIIFDRAEAARRYPGAQRLLECTISKVNQVADGSLPIRWSADSSSSRQRKLQVVLKTQESADITSFHLRPSVGQDPVLWGFKPGQHLPIQLKINDDKTLLRTYSLSGGSNWGEYRISVKREAFGEGSRHLHDNIKVGDTIDTQPPAGDFVLNEVSDRTLVLLSAGVGVTPILSMLHAYANSQERNRKAVWIHGARNGEYHAFKSEIDDLEKLAGEFLSTHVAYSRPTEKDAGCFDSKGRVTPELVMALVPGLLNSEIYMCGPSGMCADLEEGLQQMGVDPNYIHFETF
jgi:uncharacterized protein